jgi:hypothetical protein
MHVNGRTGRLRAHARSSGFSLIEVVVASGLLLLTIIAVTFCVTSVSAGGGRLQAVMDADRAVRLVADRLVAMPFYGSDAGAGAPLGLQVEDLVGAVFPHADAARNTPAARYVHSNGEDAPPGSFVTVFTEGVVEVVCVARFLPAEDGPPLEPVVLEGWALADGDQPPGSALAIHLTATSRGTTRSADIIRAALALPPIRPASPTAVAP